MSKYSVSRRSRDGRRDAEGKTAGSKSVGGRPAEPARIQEARRAAPDVLAAVASLDTVASRVRAALTAGDTQASDMPDILNAREGQEVLAVCSRFMMVGGEIDQVAQWAANSGFTLSDDKIFGIISTLRILRWKMPGFFGDLLRQPISALWERWAEPCNMLRLCQVTNHRNSGS